MDTIIKKVLNKIEENGYQAFIVGGYVRDQLLGIVSYDVDICTNALPKDVHNIFNITKGNNYGGSNLKIDKYNIDITTFREELKYVNRNPVEIKYIDNLDDDLKRRDFTINALCMDSEGRIIDIFNGTEDLNNRIIRSIGDASIKIKEDPLRILRAIRFATILNFKIDDTLLNVLKENALLVKTLSKERIKKEYSKILMSENYKVGLQLSKDLGLDDILEIKYDDITYTSDLLGMWAQVEIKDLPFTKEEKSNIIKITEVIKSGVIDNYTLYNYGLYISLAAGVILNYSPVEINKMYKNLPIKDRHDINITSQELISLLKISPGKLINEIYTTLEHKILKYELPNDNMEIKKYLLQQKGS